MIEDLKEYTELNDSTCEILTEEKDGKKSYIIRGSFSRADTKNANNRIYPRAVMEEAVKNVQPLIEAGKFVAELEHPASAKINLERIAAKINKLEMMEDGTVVGEMKVLDTEAGKTIKNLIDEKVFVGVSTRGSGSVKPKKVKSADGLTEETILEVQPGFKLVAVDLVSMPSAQQWGSPECFVESVNPNNNYSGKTINQIFKEMF